MLFAAITGDSNYLGSGGVPLGSKKCSPVRIGGTASLYLETP